MAAVQGVAHTSAAPATASGAALDEFSFHCEFGCVKWDERGFVRSAIRDIEQSSKPWVRSITDVLALYDAEGSGDVVWELDCARDMRDDAFDKMKAVLSCAGTVGLSVAKHRKLLRRVVSEVRVVCREVHVDKLRSTVESVLQLIPSGGDGARQVAVRVMTPRQAAHLRAADACFAGASS